MTTLKLGLRVSGIVTALCACSCIAAFPQGLYNGAAMQVSGTTLYVDGEVVNTGTLDNDGVISFTGDWHCKGKYKGHGVVEARGNKPQRITHFGQQMWHLLVNGWGTKYVKGSLFISAELSLKEGIVEVSSADQLRLGQGAIVSGGSPDSYIDGALGVAGNGYKFFPIGKRGIYAPLEFLNVKGSFAEYAVEVFENAPVTSVENVLLRRSLYWQRKDIAGSFGGSTVAVDCDRRYFDNPEEVILVIGSNWDSPFNTVENVHHSNETDKLITNVEISSPIIMLGEISEKWTEADFYFSSALSPNAALHENRTVKIFGDRLTEAEFRFEVFNRWGDLVFESASLHHMSSNGWDGRSNKGSVLMGGTYPYRLTAVDKTGKKLEKKGVITIVH